jgi:hypothetical protein
MINSLFHTKIGGAVSAMVLILLIIFAMYRFQSLIAKQNNSITIQSFQRDLTVYDGPKDIGANGFDFAIALQNKEGANVYSEEYFKFELF